MRHTSLKLLIVSLGLLSLTAVGCGGGDVTPVGCTPRSGTCFNLATFEESIVAAVQDGTVGYAYAISSGGSYYGSGGGGWSRTPADGSQPMGAGQRMNIASISKTITGIAALQVLHDLGIGIDSSISFFLPAHWALGPNTNLISFRDLLMHRSGIRDIPGTCDNAGDSSYATIKTRIANGIQAADNGVACYQNMNFALFRILIPYLRGHTYPGNDTDDASQTATAYRDYVNQHVLVPSGATHSDVKPPSSTPALAYPFPDDGLPGQYPGDWTLESGGGGWYLSALDLNRLLRRLLYTEILLPAAVRQEMLDFGLGTQRRSFVSQGVAYKHNGVVVWGAATSVQRGLWSCYFAFPNGVEAVLFYNSHPGPKFINSILVEAWQGAWE